MIQRYEGNNMNNERDEHLIYECCCFLRDIKMNSLSFGTTRITGTENDAKLNCNTADIDMR